MHITRKLVAFEGDAASVSGLKLMEIVESLDHEWIYVALEDGTCLEFFAGNDDRVHGFREVEELEAK